MKGVARSSHMTSQTPPPYKCGGGREGVWSGLFWHVATVEPHSYPNLDYKKIICMIKGVSSPVETRGHATSYYMR